jgi:hypothetical protein
MRTDEPLAVAVEAIQTGDAPALKRLVADNPELARLRAREASTAGGHP